MTLCTTYTHIGRLTLSKWCEAMEAATKLGLPWRLLRDKLAPPDANRPTTEVTYRRTLDMLEDDLIVSTTQKRSLSVFHSSLLLALLADLVTHLASI